MTGIFSYTIAKEAIIANLKSRDLNYIAQSISAQIDGRMARAQETSLMLANDPVIQQWFLSKEKDQTLGQYAKQTITDVTQKLDYDNAFMVSALTGHYWAENSQLIDTMSKNDEDDSWFFQALAAKKKVDITIDFNRERKDTFAFVNAMMIHDDKPLAIVGVGLNLKDITAEFNGYKFGEQSNMWLVDKSGDIYISEDIEQAGKNISRFLPTNVWHNIVFQTKSKDKKATIMEYRNSEGVTYDLLYQPIKSTDWQLVLQIPRKESVSIIDAIKTNTAVACLLTIILIVFIFYIISKRIANPYRQAIKLSKELEKLVQERTQELNDKNKKLMDSIEYAQLIQESILASDEEFAKIFKEHFILWKPRDIVGGDFYFLKKYATGSILFVGDCTGHGVPGALMTMAANSILNHVVDENSIKNPSYILRELNSQLKHTLYGRNTCKLIDDGLDAGIIYIPKQGNLLFAGAKLSLYVKDAEGITLLKGDSKGIGCRKISEQYDFNQYEVPIKPNSRFYLTTDGYLDQNGGAKNLPFGRTRFEAVIEKYFSEELAEQDRLLLEELEAYKGTEAQIDDITVIGLKL
jgi:serine phosphatase RsbU (regulator of sigma subunit)